jgi:predicted membrane chloride channel (bestrophin family)
MYSFFIGTKNCPLTKHIVSFVHQALGSSMTLGSCSRYIELCPPFGYSSKHMKIFCCLLHRKLMSMSCFLILIIFHVFCPREVSLNLSQPFCSLSLDLMSRTSRESSQVLIQNRRSYLPHHQDPYVFSR